MPYCFTLKIIMKRILPACMLVTGISVAPAGEPSVEIVPAYLTVASKRVPTRLQTIEKGTAIGLIYKTHGDCRIDVGGYSGGPDKEDLWLCDSSGNRHATVRPQMLMSGHEYPVVEYRTGVLPRADSKSVVLNGSIPVSILVGKEVSKPVVFNIRKGETFTISKLTFNVIRVSGQKFTLSVTSEEETLPFDLVFRDSAGKDFEPKLERSSGSSMMGKADLNNTYELPKGMTKLGVAVSTWKERKNVTVPVNVRLDLSSVTPVSQP